MITFTVLKMHSGFLKWTVEFGKEKAGRQSRLRLPVPRTELTVAWITVGGEMAQSE